MPDGVWPLSTHLYGSYNTGYFFRIRDKDYEHIKDISLKDMPLMFLDRPHIRAAYDTDSNIKEILDKAIKDAG